MRNMSLNNMHPLVLFWLGLLTGAIVVGLVFFYRVLTPADYQDASLRFKGYSPSTVKSLQMKGSISPGMLNHKSSISPGMLNLKSSISPGM